MSVGPLLIGKNGTQVEETPCVKQKRSERSSAVKCLSMQKNRWDISLSFLCSSVFQVAVYMLSVMGATLLLILIFTAWMSFRKQKLKPKQVSDALDGNDLSQ